MLVNGKAGLEVNTFAFQHVTKCFLCDVAPAECLTSRTQDADIPPLAHSLLLSTSALISLNVILAQSLMELLAVGESKLQRGEQHACCSSLPHSNEMPGTITECLLGGRGKRSAQLDLDIPLSCSARESLRMRVSELSG